eukprot:Clim_evm3s229 gene=Clim_evmTU3s229
MPQAISDTVDVAIIGGGPAGLTTALYLLRARRTVAIIDEEMPRNRYTAHSHGVFTREHITPSELRQLANADLKKFTGWARFNSRVVAVENKSTPTGRFTLKTSDGKVLKAHAIMLATGQSDRLPIDKYENFEAFWGKSIHNCPFCDGYESRSKRIAVLGNVGVAMMKSQMLQLWTDSVSLFTDGKKLPDEKRHMLEKRGITIVEDSVVGFKGDTDAGEVKVIVAESGKEYPVDKVFYLPPASAVLPFMRELGLETYGAPDGAVPKAQEGDFEFIKIGDFAATSVPGIFAGGDLTTMQTQINLSVGSGALAGMGIVKYLSCELGMGIKDNEDTKLCTMAA